MIVTYCPHSKNIHNLKYMEFVIFVILNIFEKNKKVFYHMSMTYKTKLKFIIQGKKPKIINIFGYDSKLW